MISAYPQEQALIDYLLQLPKGDILCTSLGRAQFAFAAAQDSGNHVTCHFIDLYRAQLAQVEIGILPTNLTIECSQDFPEKEFDLFVMPTSATGEAELTRDLMQQGFLRLKMNGQMIVSTNNIKDSWLENRMKELFSKIQKYMSEKAVIYSGVKTASLKKIKNFVSEFAFRDQGHLIQAVSRPGVFSHRHLDLGARKLMDKMAIKDNDKLLDIGCGWGAVALAASLRAKDVEVLSIDSNARAIECTEKSAQLNQIKNITAKLTATGEIDNPGSYDLVLANPPYYANFRIAELFAVTGHKALKSGGQILFVTKSPQWYEHTLSNWFKSIEVESAKDYFVISAYKN